MTTALLALADGRVFRGRAFGHAGRAVGEVVFNTSMTGYQEILTDPSYEGQLVSMTYPEIGNYGINPEDVESRRPWVRGFIVKEACRFPSSWRSTMTLGDYLARNEIVGIEGIDTRALTRHLREAGSMMGVLDATGAPEAEVVALARGAESLGGRDLVRDVTRAERETWRESLWDLRSGYGRVEGEGGPHVVALDFGIKSNILRGLVDAGMRVTVVPGGTTAEEILGLEPDGIFLSNGPGDPEGVPAIVAEVRKLLGKRPIFGICLGHQILGLALGGKTFKLKFGHHGGNQPVMDLTTGKVEITAQNHNYAVDVESLGPDVEVTHVNLNDRTVEGLRHKKMPIFSVQYHPEASPGPHDASYLFARFRELIGK